MKRTKNKWIPGMAFVMSGALVGLIFVQSFWIRNAYKSQELQFDLTIASAQRRIIDDVREFELLNLQREEDMPFPYRLNSVRRTSKAELDSIMSFSDYERVLVRNYFRFDPDSTTLGAGEWQEPVMSLSAGITEVTPSMTQYREQWVRDNEPAINRYLLKTQRGELTLSDRIDKESFDYIVRAELEKAGLDMPDEYAALDEKGVLMYRSDNYYQKVSFHKYERPLFDGGGYILSIYFPEHENYLFKSVGLIAATSIILMIVLVAMFMISIYTIVHQKKLSEMRTDFMNNVTHELKTPISTISLASQMLADPSIPLKAKNLEHLASVINHESKRLSNQVEKVLQMAIFENGKMNLRWKILNVNQLLEIVMENVAIQVIDRHGSIDLFLDADRSEIQADEIHFTNVLFNLIDNAIKYSKGVPHIEIFTSNVGNELLISVKDDGIGIPKLDQKRIFDQFYRVHTGNVHNVKGFGLGLSYVNRMVVAHKGRIVLESEVNAGTTFHLYLPLSGSGTMLH